MSIPDGLYGRSQSLEGEGREWPIRCGKGLSSSSELPVPCSLMEGYSSWGNQKWFREEVESRED